MTTTEIPANELKYSIGRVLNDVLRGETYVITRYGEPIATIAPIKPEAAPKRSRGRSKAPESP